MHQTKSFHLLFSTIPVLIMVLVFALIGQGQAESDTLWHIKAGEWALHNGIPIADPFSWTMRGEKWFAHEWLWEVSAAWIYQNWGHTGIWLYTCFWALIFCGSLWFLLINRCSLPRAVLVFSLIAISCSIFWNARPHPMAQALFALTILALINSRKKPVLLVLIPLIIIVWANAHGSAPLGVALCGLYWLLSCVPFNRIRPNLHIEEFPGRLSLMLGLTTAASFAASLINPHGIHLWSYMINVSGDPLMVTYITEWHSPDFKEIYYWPIIIIALFLFTQPIVNTRFKDNKVNLFEIVLMCGFFFLALEQKRHAPYFYFTAALVMGSLLGFERGGLATRLSTSFKVFLVGLLASLTILAAWFKPPTWIKDSDFFPVHATNYLIEHKLVDNLFNQYEFGGYLIWHNISPFIDGRADLYLFDAEIYKDYIRANVGKLPTDDAPNPLPAFYLDKYNVNTVFIALDSRLDLYLTNHPNWMELYRDPYAVIYKKVGRRM